MFASAFLCIWLRTCTFSPSSNTSCKGLNFFPFLPLPAPAPRRFGYNRFAWSTIPPAKSGHDRPRTGRDVIFRFAWEPLIVRSAWAPSTAAAAAAAAPVPVRPFLDDDDLSCGYTLISSVMVGARSERSSEGRGRLVLDTAGPGEGRRGPDTTGESSMAKPPPPERSSKSFIVGARSRGESLEESTSRRGSRAVRVPPRGGWNGPRGGRARKGSPPLGGREWRPRFCHAGAAAVMVPITVTVTVTVGEGGGQGSIARAKCTCTVWGAASGAKCTGWGRRGPTSSSWGGKKN